MSTDQAIALGILAGALILFVWGRWRHDVVAVITLVAAVVAGIVPSEDAFAGFANNAVITVAAILVLSKVLRDSGLVDIIGRRLAPLTKGPVSHVTALTALVAVLSSVMNNVGALALLMPVAITSARRAGRPPGQVLMPLAFGSILGGLLTLIGTPANLIVADYRRDLVGEAFGMFDFTVVGALVALAGVVFVGLVGWRLIPIRGGVEDSEHLFRIENYITEYRVPEGARVTGQPLREIEHLAGHDVVVAALVRDGKGRRAPGVGEVLRPDDVLLIQGDPTTLRHMVRRTGLVHTSQVSIARRVRSDAVVLVEAVVKPGSILEGRTAAAVRLRAGTELNVLAISSHGRTVDGRLQDFELGIGDVLLLQGEVDRINDMVSAFGLLPLAQRDLPPLRKRRILLPLFIFAGAIAASAIGWVSPAVAFVAAVLLMILLKMLPVRNLYRALDIPIIVLLAAMIPVGHSLETTGTAELIAHQIVVLSGELPTAWVLVILFFVTMMLSDVINNAATAVIMAPLGASMAIDLGVSVDAFLMTVAIASSCAFLTPIGHQSNALVMGPGAYRFGDYWRMGLPVKIIAMAVGVPAVLLVFPL